jgi:2-dehydropantoate 2-reductase
MEFLNFLVFGAGAIGTYVGGSLAAAGHRVTFIDQPEVIQQLRSQGLLLDLSADRRRHTTPKISLSSQNKSVRFAASLQEALQDQLFDFGIFALKSFDTFAAVEAMRPFVVDLPPFLCLSNGVENESALAEALGKDKVLAGTVTSSVGRRAAGNIVLERLRGVGVEDGHPLSLCLASALDEAGLNTRLYPRAAEMKWSKLLTNLLANASTAILDMSPSEVLADPRLFNLEMSMLREALQVMRARGIRVVDTPKTPVRLLALAVSLPSSLARPLLVKAAGGGRGKKMPSFHIDLYARRGRTEVQWLNGAVTRFGEQARITTPVNRLLTDTLLSMTCGDISLAEMAHQPEKLLKLVGSMKNSNN